MGRQSVFITSHQSGQSVFTIGLQGHQSVIGIGWQGHRKVIKGRHMSRKMIGVKDMDDFAGTHTVCYLRPNPLLKKKTFRLSKSDFTNCPSSTGVGL